MSDLYTRFEEFKAIRDRQVQSNPGDPPSAAIFKHFNDVVKFEDFLATLRDAGETIDPDDVELTAREMGMTGPTLQGFLEGLAGWW